MNKGLKIIGNILYSIVFLVLALMIIMVLSSRLTGGEPQLFGYQFKTVLSGSMEPAFKTGSLIVVKKINKNEKLVRGDVITFIVNETSVVTHRINDVLIKGNTVFYQTKGDNNKQVDMDLVPRENVVAKYSSITIPYVGYFLKSASSKMGTALLMIIPGILLLLYSAWTVRLAIKEIEVKMKEKTIT
ncbi:signal peptidase I SipW [Neobacillus sp. YIM B06451]|uniref:signal peptidase I SipW n=1 Tax=Neobacillus sp. YIM B06451 TaxID=3070994 RepID=UPI00292E9D5D|nr:signal peptidase I [Neobacillus sp. YIM B06451]